MVCVCVCVYMHRHIQYTLYMRGLLFASQGSCGNEMRKETGKYSLYKYVVVSTNKGRLKRKSLEHA